MKRCRSVCHRVTRSVIVAVAFLIFLAGCGNSRTASNPAVDSPPIVPSADMTVAVIDGYKLPLSEFENQYRRTAGPDVEFTADSLGAFEDFLNRYVDFRAKVLEAQAAGYGDRTDLQEEIQNYRKQLARPYVVDQNVTDPLIKELYDRRQMMVEASHILIRVTEGASPADTLKAFELISSLRDSVLAGANFGDLAERYSQDPSAQNPSGNVGYRGYLGFFGGGRMVKEFEDQAYETPIGDVSPVFRSQFGYHILKVQDRRNTPDDIRLAHIMIRPEGPTPADTAAALARIHEVQQKLSTGEDFAALASEYSDDESSARQGGELRRISFDSGLPASMRDAAFSLSVDEVSDVVTTPFGYHILKVLEKLPKDSFDEQYVTLKAQVARLPRAKKAEEAFARKLSHDLGGRVDSTMIRSWFSLWPADSLFRLMNQSLLPDSIASQPIAWLNDSSFAARKFAEFFRNQAHRVGPDPEHQVLQSANDFLAKKALEYEISSLEDRDEAFRRTMDEFRDGLELFRLMEDSVWNAASNDSSGLRAYYDQHASEYQFGDRTRVISLSHPSDSLLASLVEEIRNGTSIQRLIEEIEADSVETVRIDTTRIEGSTNSVFDRILEMDQGQISDPASYNQGYMVLYNDGREPARQKTFDEARAEVVNGYQGELDARLITRLRAKYHVVVYPERLKLAYAPAVSGL